MTLKRRYKIITNSKSVFVLFFSLCILTGCGTDRYVCYFYENKSVSDFNKFVLVSGKKSERVLDLALWWTSKMDLYKSYDEGHQILTVYKERRSDRDYFILKLSLSGPAVSLSYGYGYHLTPEQFHKGYGLPYTEKNLSRFNRNPELIRYLPEKTDERRVSLAFFKRTLGCDSINYFEYIKKSGFILLLALMGAFA